MTGDEPGRRIKRFTEYLVEAGHEDRRRKIEGWVRALQTAEAEAARQPDADLRLYQVSYRVKEVAPSLKWPSAQRRSALVELLEALEPLEKHQSTSSWVVQLHISDAREVARLLAPPLSDEHDFLSVAEVTDNRHSLGDADLD